MALLCLSDLYFVFAGPPFLLFLHHKQTVVVVVVVVGAGALPHAKQLWKSRRFKAHVFLRNKTAAAAATGCRDLWRSLESNPPSWREQRSEGDGRRGNKSSQSESFMTGWRWGRCRWSSVGLE